MKTYAFILVVIAVHFLSTANATDTIKDDNSEQGRTTENIPKLDKAINSLKKYRYSKALPIVKYHAESGDALAQQLYGIMFYNGQGVTQDFDAAFFWLHKASLKEMAQSQFYLAHMYKYGNGKTQNYKESRSWALKSANNNYEHAQVLMGSYYLEGLGVKVDFDKAITWFELSNKKNNSNGKYGLGMVYSNKKYKHYNMKKAVLYFRQAVSLKHAQAQFELGKLYEKGKGVSKDTKQARQLYTQAAIQNIVEARNKLKKLNSLQALGIGAFVGKLAIIPSGTFMMGSTNGDKNELPVHEVSIKAFNMMSTEVTWQQFLYCVAEGHCNKPYGYNIKVNEPVTSVNIEDIEQYIKWLNKKTKQQYRLPSEAEWEYAARAGTTGKYSWGNGRGCIKHASCATSETVTSFGKIKPVASYKPNAFGLFDMHGNVWEWTLDCWNDSYIDSPSDGSANTDGQCKKRVVRGGSFKTGAKSLRSANRYWRSAHLKDYHYGFRLVLDKI